jgi:putative flippase GtrA
MACAPAENAIPKNSRQAGNAAVVPQLSRYSVVSIAALATDVLVYISLCALAVNVPVAGIIGYAVGMIAHYALSTAFVFDVAHARKSAPRRLAEFAGSGLLGLMLTGFIIAAMTDYFAASAIAAKVVAIIISFLAVFLVRRCIVFAPASDKNIWDGKLVYSKSGSCD